MIFFLIQGFFMEGPINKWSVFFLQTPPHLLTGCSGHLRTLEIVIWESRNLDAPALLSTAVLIRSLKNEMSQGACNDRNCMSLKIVLTSRFLCVVCPDHAMAFFPAAKDSDKYCTPCKSKTGRHKVNHPYIFFLLLWGQHEVQGFHPWWDHISFSSEEPLSLIFLLLEGVSASQCHVSAALLAFASAAATCGASVLPLRFSPASWANAPIVQAVSSN